MKFKKGDKVIVISGKQKGTSGIIKEIFLKENKIVVEGINVKKIHVKPTQQNPEGGILEIEKPIHASNVMFNIGDKNKSIVSRITYKFEEKNGKKEKKRIAKKNGEVI